MGRAEDNEIILADVGVSRRHAAFVVNGGQVRVEDLGSGNGTYFRGRRVEAQALTDGDEVIIDPFVLRVRFHGVGADSASAADDAGARLDVISGPALARSSYAIGTGGLTLGRSETRDVVITDAASSRHHCSVFLQDGRFVLRDMGSANGTYLNGNRVREGDLGDGDRVRIGNTEFRFVMGDATKVGSIDTGDYRPSPGMIPVHVDAELSEVPVPMAPRPPAPAMRWMVPVAFGGTVALLLVALIGTVGIVSVYFYANRAQPLRPVRPMAWHLELPADTPKATAEELFARGPEQIRNRQSEEALRTFYQALQLLPGNVYAERYAMLSGEYVVLDALQGELAKAEAAEQERSERRAQLLEQADWRGARGFSAKKALEDEYRDDPRVMAAMKWRPSKARLAFGDLLKQGDEALAAQKVADATRLFDEALASASEATWRTEARERLAKAERAAVPKIAEDWRAGVEAEADGLPDVARSHFNAVQRDDPANASARLHLARLDAPKP